MINWTGGILDQVLVSPFLTCPKLGKRLATIFQFNIDKYYNWEMGAKEKELNLWEFCNEQIFRKRGINFVHHEKYFKIF